MSQINDAILAVVGAGQLNDQLLKYYHDNGDTGAATNFPDINGAERDFLRFNGTKDLGETINDFWNAFLVNQGFTVGSVDDRKLAFWAAGGLSVTAPIWTTDPPNAPDGVDTVAYNYNFTPDLNTVAGVVLTSTGAGGLPSGLAIVGLTLQGTPDTVTNNTLIQITATNGAGFDQSLVFAIDIAAAPAAPVWTTDPPNPPDGQDTVVYAGHDFQGDVDVTSTFAVTAGSLPSGLSLATNGLLTGTPDTEETQAGIRVTATNGVGGTQSLAFDIDIAASGPALGVELLSDPGFDSAGDWSLQAGWSISGSQGHTASGATATNGCQANNPAPLIVDATNYRIQIETLNGSYANGGLHLQFNGTASQTIALADGVHILDILTTNSQTIFRYRQNASNDFVGDFDNASCKELL